MHCHQNFNYFVSCEQDRTNNHAEAAHRRLQEELGMDHPLLWKLIDGLRKVQKSRDLDHQKMISGHPPRSKKKKYRDADNRIVKLINRFIGGDGSNQPQSMLESLKGIAHNFQMDP